MTAIEMYRYPNDGDPEVKKLKRLAGRVGRTFVKRESEKCETATRKLKDFMVTLEIPRLLYWASVIMIDHRWCGATGANHFWAVASRVINETAVEILEVHVREWKQKYGDAMFVVE